MEKLQGSSMEQCCERIYCGNYTCDTDDDGDGDGTMWYKRVDTNTCSCLHPSDFWRLGVASGTNGRAALTRCGVWKDSIGYCQECCLPKYCSQYTTSTPTQYLTFKTHFE